MMINLQMNNPIFATYQNRHEKTLADLIESAEIPASRIKHAMQYALFPGGKRLRPLLMYVCGELLDIKLECLDIMAASIELIHCYSLIHDDLPAMDNDDFRRGKLSTHRAFDEATAILVGDGLQAFAIEILLTHLAQHLSSQKIAQITLALIRACGPSGMVSGQSLDLSELTHTTITADRLAHIHHLKTGKLIQACVQMVLHAGQPQQSMTDALQQLAWHLGLVFQMQDDYLDRYAQPLHLGKNRASDAVNQKTTFATIYIHSDLLELINFHFKQTYQLLLPFGQKAKKLKTLLLDLESRSPLSSITINE